MNFIYSQYLLFLPLIIAPLIIYLIFREKPKQMVFSSLYILKELALKINKRTRLKDILLLIIRTLIVICIIMFFAAPYLGERSNFDPDLDTSLFIYFDTSTSMGLSDENFSVFDRTLSSLRKFINDTPERSEIIINTSDPSKKFIGSKKDAKLFLSDISVSGMQRDINSIISDVDSFYVAKDVETNKEFLIFSDGKMRSDGNPVEYTSEYGKYFIKDNIEIKDKNDISIDSVKINQKNQIACFVSSNNVGKISRTKLELYENGNKIYSENINFEDSNKKTVIIDHSNISISDTQMFFKLENDMNLMNNTFYFIIPGLKKINVLIVGNKDDIMIKSLLVLMNTASDSLFNPSVVDFNNINSIMISDFDEILFSDIKKLSSYTVSQLSKLLRIGKSVIFTYGKDLNLNDYNSNAVTALKLPNIKGFKKFTDSYSSIKIINNDHPIFNKVFVNDIDPNSLEIYSYYNLQASDWSVIAEADNSPYILEKNIFEGKVILISSGFDKVSSNIIENGFIVPLIHNSLRYLNQRTLNSDISYFCGDKLSVGKGIKVLDPKSTEVSNLSSQKQSVLLSRQGFYTLKNESDGSLQYVAVNNIREDNDLISKEYLNDFEFIDADTFTENNIFSVERNNYSFIFLYGLILLITAEIILARKL